MLKLGSIILAQVIFIGSIMHILASSILAAATLLAGHIDLERASSLLVAFQTYTGFVSPSWSVILSILSLTLIFTLEAEAGGDMVWRKIDREAVIASNEKFKIRDELRELLAELSTRSDDRDEKRDKQFRELLRLLGDVQSRLIDIEAAIRRN